MMMTTIILIYFFIGSVLTSIWLKEEEANIIYILSEEKSFLKRIFTVLYVFISLSIIWPIVVVKRNFL